MSSRNIKEEGPGYQMCPNWSGRKRTLSVMGSCVSHSNLEEYSWVISSLPVWDKGRVGDQCWQFICSLLKTS